MRAAHEEMDTGQSHVAIIALGASPRSPVVPVVPVVPTVVVPRVWLLLLLEIRPVLRRVNCARPASLVGGGTCVPGSPVLPPAEQVAEHAWELLKCFSDRSRSRSSLPINPRGCARERHARRRLLC